MLKNKGKDNSVAKTLDIEKVIPETLCHGFAFIKSKFTRDQINDRTIKETPKREVDKIIFLYQN